MEMSCMHGRNSIPFYIYSVTPESSIVLKKIILTYNIFTNQLRVQIWIFLQFFANAPFLISIKKYCCHFPSILNWYNCVEFYVFRLSLSAIWLVNKHKRGQTYAIGWRLTHSPLIGWVWRHLSNSICVFLCYRPWTETPKTGDVVFTGNTGTTHRFPS